MPAPTDPARDLLFGMLALQNGFIDQSRLVLAFQSWRLDRARPLAEILVEQRAIDADQRLMLDALAAQVLKTHGGDVGRSLTALPAGSTTKSLLRSLGDPELDESVTRLGPPTPTAADDESYVTHFAVDVGRHSVGGTRYRFLRPHARGGLGAVHVALDSELHREVALKEILPNHADDPVSRQRFLAEAEITGALEHPGIVPVYGLGTYADGRPYYAMRFIKGDSLKEAISRFHRPEGSAGRAAPGPDGGPAAGSRELGLRLLLRRFLDVCNAIHYAHCRGVLHRDIKPGNIIVGKYGETLVVDWGLAKARGRAGADSAERPITPSTSGGSAETLPGFALGTPAYMSPEQARGDLDNLDARSDVFSLGTTLYHILVGRPPFLGELSDVLRAVGLGAFDRPRSLAPWVDPALEAVCLKAMAHRPDDRYASARELAEDLDRWLADEPVTAWREPFSRRARRWVNRHRTGVTAASVAVLAATAGLASVLGVLAVKNAELSRANQEVRERLKLAMDSIQTFTNVVTDDEVLKRRDLAGLRARLLSQPRAFYERLQSLLRGQDDAASRRTLAQSYTALGRLSRNIGTKQESLAACRRAIEVLAPMTARDPGDFDAAYALAHAYHAAGNARYTLGQASDALENYRRSAAILERLTRLRPADAEVKRDLVVGWNTLAVLLGDLGHPEEAREVCDRSLGLSQELVRSGPSDSAGVSRARLAMAYRCLAALLDRAGNRDEALAAYDRAVESQQAAADADPGEPSRRADLAEILFNKGTVLGSAGRVAEAIPVYERARSVFQPLVDEYPAATRYRSGLASARNNLSILYREAGRTSDALEEARKRRDDIQVLVEFDPADATFQADLARSHGLVGLMLSDEGKTDEALVAYDRQRAIQETLAAAAPDALDRQAELATTWYNTGSVHSGEGRPEEALGAFEKALAPRRRLAGQFPANAEYQADLASCLHEMARAEAMLRRRPAARDRFALAVEARRNAYRAAPGHPEYRQKLRDSLYGLGWATLRTGDPSRAGEVARELAGHAEGDAEVLYQSAQILAWCSELSPEGDPTDRYARESISQLDRAVAAGWQDPARAATDRNLSPLHGRADFNRWLAGLFDTIFPRNAFAD